MKVKLKRALIKHSDHAFDNINFVLGKVFGPYFPIAQYLLSFPSTLENRAKVKSLKLNQLITMNCRKKTGAKILVEVFILTHVVNSLPLFICHLLFDGLCSKLFLAESLPPQL